MPLRLEKGNAISTPLSSAHAVKAFANAFFDYQEGRLVESLAGNLR